MNSAQLGGALFFEVYCQNSLIENSKFVSNLAGYGGAMTAYFEDKTSMNVKNCTFLENSSPNRGGAIHITFNQASTELTNVYYSPYFSLEKCCFKNNDATHYGGAIFYHFYFSQTNYLFFEPIFKISSSQFLNCYSSNGGSFSSFLPFLYEFPILHLTNNSFINSYSQYYGAALFVKKKKFFFFLF